MVIVLLKASVGLMVLGGGTGFLALTLSLMMTSSTPLVLSLVVRLRFCLMVYDGGGSCLGTVVIMEKMNLTNGERERERERGLWESDMDL